MGHFSVEISRTPGSVLSGNQQHARWQHDRVTVCFAAVQHAFPEAVVRARLNGTDPNRSFAAWQLDVSHADKGDTTKRLPIDPQMGLHFAATKHREKLNDC